MPDVSQSDPDSTPENSEEEVFVQAEMEPGEEKFFSGALRRITWVIALSAILLPPIVYFQFGRRVAVSLVIGALVALFNFIALRKVVAAIANQQIETHQARRVVVLRSMLRYALVAGIFYAIFKGSAINLYGLIAGLSLPVFAVFVEAGCESLHVFRKR